MVKLKKIEGRIRDLDNLADSERTDTDSLQTRYRLGYVTIKTLL